MLESAEKPLFEREDASFRSENRFATFAEVSASRRRADVFIPIGDEMSNGLSRSVPAVVLPVRGVLKSHKYNS